MKEVSRKIARWSLLILAFIFLVLFIVFAMIYPIPSKASFTCSLHQHQCELSKSSPVYTKSSMTIKDHYDFVYKNDNGTINIDKHFNYTINVVPNSHVCVYYCFQGVLSNENPIEQDDFVPVLMAATATKETKTNMGIVYGSVTILCVGMLISACLSQ
ncbi:Hypothetical_protein [Hexamita inflata]|uniref:Hypothetical_protein n=1 Tax=Hexamita inflata TaxID=28002 RepID=A0AA86RKM8_9EUKA|nr:Hypothetical protein HINF_LOCUS50475 [Hexamita inflata]CAI9970523.1 Hypothetical protein HINF_LOCUS58168 [Hexamita inflata]CAI9978412.1 Hypothetical protein HINF_LOCUS66057 [Hexamita inflata]